MATGSDSDGAGDDPADRVLEKLRIFVNELDADERAVLAALLAPGVAGAFVNEAEVAGFSAAGWTPERLPEALAARVRDGRLRIEVD